MTGRRAILVVTPWKRRWELGGGAGLSDDLHFIRGLTARGFDVHYVCPHDADPPDLESPGYHLHSFPNFFDATARWPTAARRLLWPVLFNVLATWRAWRVGRDVRPRVVLAQSHVAGVAAFLAARALRVPSAVKLFGVMDLSRADASRWQHLRRNFETIAALRVPHAAWIVLDDGTRGDEALRRYGVPADRIHFLPNGVDLDWQGRSADGSWLRGVAGIEPGIPIVLYVARLVDWKRPSAFVRVAALVRERFAGRVAFVVAGDGPERARCESLAHALGIASDVRFVGPVPHDRIPDAMAAAHILAATSLYSNRSIAVCEALVCGVPVVAFDTGETNAVVRDGETGRLVPDGDLEAAAAAIVNLLGDESLRTAMGERARAFARAHFTAWDERVAMEVDVLEKVAARNVAGRAAG